MAVSNKRERELARQRYERQRQRRAEERRRARRRQTILASVLSVLIVIGGAAFLGTRLTDDDKNDTAAAQSTPSASPSSSASAAAKPCAYTKEGQPAKPVAVPKFDAKAAAQPYTATLKTTRGDIVIDMLTAKAPCATFSFRHLAEHNFFDGTPCPRVVSDANFGVLQCGDPTGTGSGGPGYRFPDENLAGATYPAGTLAMANAGPDTNGSQFFIVFKNTQLPPSYIPFGKVVKGLDVVTKVGAGGNDGSNQAGGGKPKLAISIEDVVIAKK